MAFKIRYQLLKTPFVQKKCNTFRSSHQRCSIIKGVYRNFAKFKGKHLCLSLFFNKAAGLRRPATLLKTRLWHRCFPVKFVKFLRTPFFVEHLWWLLLNFSNDNTVSLQVNSTDNLLTL